VYVYAVDLMIRKNVIGNLKKNSKETIINNRSVIAVVSLMNE